MASEKRHHPSPTPPTDPIAEVRAAPNGETSHPSEDSDRTPRRRRRRRGSRGRGGRNRQRAAEKAAAEAVAPEPVAPKPVTPEPLAPEPVAAEPPDIPEVIREAADIVSDSAVDERPEMYAHRLPALGAELVHWRPRVEREFRYLLRESFD